MTEKIKNAETLQADHFRLDISFQIQTKAQKILKFFQSKNFAILTFLVTFYLFDYSGNFV